MSKVELKELVLFNPENVGKKFEFEEIYYLDISSVGEGIVSFENPISLSSAPSRAKRLVRQNDIIMSTVRPGNRSFSFVRNFPKNTVVSTGFAVLRVANERIDPRYLYYTISNNEFTAFLVANEQGANYPAVTPEVIGRAEIFLPPLPTQRRIASILSAYDDLIEKNLKRIKLLEELAQRTYEEWFVKFRINGKQLPIDKKTGLPEGWVRKRTDGFCEFINGYAYYTKGYSQSGYTVLDLGNISENSDLKISGKEKYIDEDLYYATKKFHLKKYDIVIAMTDVTSALRILGKTAIVDQDNKFTLNQRVGCIRSKNRNLDYSTIYALFNDFRFLEKMKSISKGAVQFYFNTKDLVEYEHILPDNAFLSEFTKVYKPLIELKMNLKDQNQKFKSSRDILLPKLMSGKITVE